MTVEDSVKYAVDGNLNIKEGDVSVRSAKRTWAFSWNSASPSIGVSGTISQAAPETTVNGKALPSKSSDGANVSLGASVRIALSPSIATNVRAARLNYEKSLIDYETTAKTIELNVRTAFYQILYEQEYIILQAKNADAAKSLYDTNKAKYNRGVLPRLDVLNSQIAYQNARLALDNAETTLQNDTAAFKNLLGLSQGQEIALSGSLKKAGHHQGNRPICMIRPNGRTLPSLR